MTDDDFVRLIPHHFGAARNLDGSLNMWTAILIDQHRKPLTCVLAATTALNRDAALHLMHVKWGTLDSTETYDSSFDDVWIVEPGEAPPEEQFIIILKDNC